MDKVHSEDSASQELLWNELCELLSVDAEDTIRFLDSCSEEEANTASSVFEEVAANLQSWEYIKCLRRLDKKYPKSLLGCLVDIAENNLNTENK